MKKKNLKRRLEALEDKLRLLGMEVLERNAKVSRPGTERVNTCEAGICENGFLKIGGTE